MFLYEDPTPDKLTTVSDKLKWYRYQNGLLQSNVAKAMKIDRIPIPGMRKMFWIPTCWTSWRKRRIFSIDVISLLDEYNLFLYKGQGERIKGCAIC